MEAFYSRFKDENRSLLLDAQGLSDLQQVVAERIQYYNTRRRHSSVGYLTPTAFLTQALSTRPGSAQ